MKRSPLKSRSARTIREAEQRTDVREQVRSECADACVAYGLIPTPNGSTVSCWAIRECHEVIPRGRRPGSHLEPELCVWICRAHHRWVTEHPASARTAGLMFHADEYEVACAAVKRLKFRAAFGRWP